MWGSEYDPSSVDALEDDKLYPVSRLAREAFRSETQVRRAIKAGELEAINLGVNKTMVYGRHAREWIQTAILGNVKPQVDSFDREEAAALIRKIRAIPFAASAGEVYFLQCAGWVKVGWAFCASKRLVDLQAGCPIAMRVLGTIKGSRSNEMSVHAALAAYRYRSEWFHYKPVVRAAIQGLLR